MEDVYALGSPITLSATVKNFDPGDVTIVRMRVTSATTNAVVHDSPCTAADGAWVAVLPPLPSDAYRVVVTATGVLTAIDPVHDVFVVAEA